MERADQRCLFSGECFENNQQHSMVSLICFHGITHSGDDTRIDGNVLFYVHSGFFIKSRCFIYYCFPISSKFLRFQKIASPTSAAIGNQSWLLITSIVITRTIRFFTEKLNNLTLKTEIMTLTEF